MNAWIRDFGGFFELVSSRRALVGLLGAMAVAVSGWGLSVSAAEAASSYISVQYEPNGVSPPTNVGLVSVTLAATSPLTSLDVKIYRSDRHRRA
jgi:hypothetical protein